MSSVIVMKLVLARDILLTFPCETSLHEGDHDQTLSRPLNTLSVTGRLLSIDPMIVSATAILKIEDPTLRGLTLGQ